MGDRELRQIFEGQNRIHLEIKQLNRQLDMILDEQRRYVSSLTEEISKRGAGIPGQQGQVSFPNTHVCRRWRLMEERKATLPHVPTELGSSVFPPDHPTRAGYRCEHSARDPETSK